MMLATRSADGWFTSDRLDNTQDQALLAMLEHAENHVNLETPNLNDNEFKDALIEAIVDGLDVNVVLSKGFNDGSKTSFSFPQQVQPMRLGLNQVKTE